MTAKNPVTENELKRHIRGIPDFPKPGILFYDISTLLRHGPAWKAAMAQMAARITPSACQCVCVCVLGEEGVYVQGPRPGRRVLRGPCMGGSPTRPAGGRAGGRGEGGA